MQNANANANAKPMYKSMQKATHAKPIIHSILPSPQPTRLSDSPLIIIKITSMRMLQTVLGHQRRGRDTVRNQVFAEI